MLDRKAERRVDQIIAELEGRKTSEIKTGAVWYSASTEKEYGDTPAGDELKWTEIRKYPFEYGKPWTNFWFRAEVSTENIEKDGDIYLELIPETDTLVYINGKPEGAVNPFHPLLKINRFLDAPALEIKAEAWGGHHFPGYHPSEGGRVLTAVAVKKKSYPLRLSTPRILRKNENLWGLYFDAVVLRGLSKTLDTGGFLYQKIISTLQKSLLQLDFHEDDSVLEEKAVGVRKLLEPLLKAENGTLTPEVISVGNAHLDHAWLWPISETTRKAARTALNMVNYTSEFPSFSFMFTQPVQMLAVKEKYPSVYGKVLEAYREGKWEPQGTSWVEPDCMLPSGEALIRQFIFGLRANRSLYPGYSGRVFWIPDSFGYNAQLPQILRGCGMEYFVTSKIGWNDTNAFPYDLFVWEGIDGTKIPAHMIIGAYEGKNTPEQIAECWGKIRHKDLQPALLRSVGEGDGGGGTMLEDLEEIEREHNLQGMPKNRWGKLEEAMKTIFTLSPPETLPVYKGELYLELHRGTYTVQADIKKYNKALERALHNADCLLSLVFADEGKSGRYTEAKALIDSSWKTLLTNHFHDILPGSCIEKAMTEAKASYRKALDDTEKAVSLLQDRDAKLRTFDFNTLTFEKNDSDAFRASLLDERTVYTHWGVIKLDDWGGISSLVTRDDRELVGSGKSLNTITLSPDTTIAWDAWDMEYDTIEGRKRIGKPVSLTVEEKGGNVLVKTEFVLSPKSKMSQTTVIHGDSLRIDFDTKVDWREEHKILRSEFPTTISAPYAQFSVPFGHVSRSTSENTSIERAQFETPSHEWTMLQDAATSCILASASKYGYRVKGGEMSISLLRSPQAPDPTADIGKHSFSYSFFVEEGSVKGLEKAIDDGYRVFNPPEKIRTMFSLPFGVKTVEGKVVLETVKVSEKEDGIVLRFYEALGSVGKIIITSGKSKYECDMTEENFSEEIKRDTLTFKPFQVRTFLLK